MNNNGNISSDRIKVATIFGGSGFVGRHVVGALAKRGYQIRVAVRRPDLAFHLQPLGNVGQIQAVQANLRYPWSVARAIEGSDVVINLVGILAETGRQKFQNVQCHGARVIAENCKANDIPMVHVSAIGADSDSASDYCSRHLSNTDALIEYRCTYRIQMHLSNTDALIEYRCTYRIQMYLSNTDALIEY